MDLRQGAALRLAVTTARAAKKYRLEQLRGDMKEIGKKDELGVGRVIAVLMRIVEALR